MRASVVMRRAIVGACAALAFSAFGSAAFAQVALPSREELDPARAAPIPAAPRGDLFDGIEKTPCPFAGSDLKMTLRSVTFRGAAPLQLSTAESRSSSGYTKKQS